MDKLHGTLAVVAVVVAAALVGAVERSAAWERRVRVSEARADTLQGSVDSLKAVAHVAEAAGAHADTVRVTLTTLIPQTDSASRPDSTCTRSLAARDAVIRVGAQEVADLQQQATAQQHALASLTAEKDTLRAALDARPKSGLALELLHPRVDVSAAWVPFRGFAVVLSVPLVSFRL